MQAKVEIIIPQTISFSELNIHLENDGSLTYNEDVLSDIAVASGLACDFFADQPPGMVLHLIVDWYLVQRDRGGLLCPALEELHDMSDLQSRYGAAYGGMPHTIQ